MTCLPALHDATSSCTREGYVLKLQTTTVWPFSAGGCQSNVPVAAYYRDMVVMG